MDDNGGQNSQGTQSTQVVQQPQYAWLSRAELGEQKAGMDNDDVGDVICILIPMSPAARKVVIDTALRSPEHVLSIDRFHPSTRLKHPGADIRGIALRLSSTVIHPYFGFTFGRNVKMCDIVLDHDAKKRVSNMHFRIYVHSDGFVMLEDMSTNGTIVDGHHLWASKEPKPATRLLDDGVLVRVGSEQDWIDFKVCLPFREDEEEDRFLARLRTYRDNLPQHEQREDEHAAWARHQYQKSYQFAVTENRQRSTFSTIGRRTYHGMHWSGKPKYSVVAKLGQGAFATVYKLVLRTNGEVFAAKELEKKRFIKEGRVDLRLENELVIMKSIRHPHVVNYVDYHEEEKYLYIIMELVPNGDLQEYLSNHRVLPEPQAQAMSSQVLQALVYLHKRKITHRDIKPDNVLIVSFEPFVVKLTDFGLSKVVKNNETFLKTFCGTLLYCAPEVFPNYEQQRRSVKRRHGGPVPKTFHSYSHSVDVWSYAAVLYSALCGQAPFEGVTDPTGYLMLMKILETPLDVTPLRNRGISEPAVDLVSKMLIKDPSKRPTDRQCLAHPWLANGSVPIVLEPESDLESIAEEENEAVVGNEQAQAFSQLSIAEEARPGAPQNQPSDDDFDFDDEDLDFLGPRASKRVKPDQLIPRNQMRDPTDFMASSIEADESMDCSNEQQNNETRRIPHAQRPGRLFGEIGASALRSSGVLGRPDDSKEGPALPGSSGGLSGEDEEWEGPIISQLDGQWDGPAASLLGAEALVGKLQVHSPESAVSPDGGTNEPVTPQTPDVVASSSQDESTQGPPDGQSAEITPKPPITKFSRRINIPIPAAFYFNGSDPSTHNLEYASKISGHDYVSEAAKTQVGPNGTVSSSIPKTMDPSLQPMAGDVPHSSTPPLASVTPMATPASFLEVPPRLGLLVTTTDSFMPIFLKIENRIESWGRDPSNTFVHPDIKDSRIGKRAFVIYNHAPGLDKKLENGEEWTHLPSLYTYITTWSSVGIYVNGVHLTAVGADGGQLTGRIYTGDVITIFDHTRREGGGECLRFVCTFYHGEAAKPRTAPFEVISAPA